MLQIRGVLGRGAFVLNVKTSGPVRRGAEMAWWDRLGTGPLRYCYAPAREQNPNFPIAALELPMLPLSRPGKRCLASEVWHHDVRADSATFESISITHVCPRSTSYERGVLQFSSAVSGAASLRPRSALTVPSYTFLAAHGRGVRPCSSAVLGETSSRSRSIFATPTFPFLAAYKRGALLPSPRALGATLSGSKASSQ